PQRLYMVNSPKSALGIMTTNRWGDQIYQTEDLSRGWDGAFQGTPVQEGVYVFQIRGRGVDGTSFERTGTVTLYR
ncbi:MAG: gliding motility-associated C-terminal domain-containing protein, partial [Bacteroidota bacterium]